MARNSSCVSLNSNGGGGGGGASMGCVVDATSLATRASGVVVDSGGGVGDFDCSGGAVTSRLVRSVVFLLI